MRCCDCGANEYEASRRRDLCMGCFKRRLGLLDAVKAGQVSLTDFKSVQRTIGNDRFKQGRAKRKIDRLLENLPRSQEED